MAKRKTSFVYQKGKYTYARIQVKQPDDSIKEFYKRAKNATRAEELALEMLRDHDERGKGFIDSGLCSCAIWRPVRRRSCLQRRQDGNGLAHVGSGNGARSIASSGYRRSVRTASPSPISNRSSRTSPTCWSAKRTRSLPPVQARPAQDGRHRCSQAGSRNRSGDDAENQEKEVAQGGPGLQRSPRQTLEDRRTVTITEAQEKMILAEAKAYTHAPRLYALILALRDSGARAFAGSLRSFSLIIWAVGVMRSTQSSTSRKWKPP